MGARYSYSASSPLFTIAGLPSKGPYAPLPAAALPPSAGRTVEHNRVLPPPAGAEANCPRQISVFSRLSGSGGGDRRDGWRVTDGRNPRVMPSGPNGTATGGCALPRRGPADVNTERTHHGNPAPLTWRPRGKGEHSLALPGGGKGCEEEHAAGPGGRGCLAAGPRCTAFDASRDPELETREKRSTMMVPSSTHAPDDLTFLSDAISYRSGRQDRGAKG